AGVAGGGRRAAREHRVRLQRGHADEGLRRPGRATGDRRRLREDARREEGGGGRWAVVGGGGRGGRPGRRVGGRGPGAIMPGSSLESESQRVGGHPPNNGPTNGRPEQPTTAERCLIATKPVGNASLRQRADCGDNPRNLPGSVTVAQGILVPF